MIKVGVLGAGRLGKMHVKLLQQLETVDLVGFYDPDNDTLKEVADKYNIQPHLSADTLLDSVDAVIIATPTTNHYESVAKALKKSKHVFIEKPLTHTLKEAKKLMALAHEANVKVQVGHVERFNPAFLSATEYIENPMFIEAHRLSEIDPRGINVSVVLDLMIHDIDIILSIVKANIKRISATGVAVIGITPDISNARIEFDNGCIANLTASRIAIKNICKTSIYQKDLYASVDFFDEKTEVVRINPVGNIALPSAVTIDLGENQGMKQISFESKPANPYNAMKMQLEAFANSILNNTTPIVTIEDGFKALDVAYMVLDKLKHTSNLPEFSDIVQ